MQLKNVLDFSLKKYAIRYCVSLVFMMLHTVSAIIFPGLISIIIDKGIMAGDLYKTFKFLGFFVFNGILLASFQYLQRMSFMKLSQDILLEMKATVFRKISKTNLSFWTKHKIGDVTYVLEHDIAKVESLLTTTFCDAMVNSFVILGMSGFLLYLDMKIGISLIVLAVVFVEIQRKAGDKIKRDMEHLRKALGDVSVLTNETLNNLQCIQVMGSMKPFVSRYWNGSRRGRDCYIKYMRAVSNSNVITNSYSIVSMLIVLVIGAVSYFDNQMTVGAILTFTLYAQRLYSPINGVCNTYVLLKNISPSIQKILDILLSEDVILCGELRPTGIQGKIVFKHVYFRYDKSKKYILQDFNLEIMPGEKIGIIGKNGSGKTTMLKLLSGLCIPEKGEIYVDDKKIESYDLDFLKSQIGFILQRDFLVSGQLSDVISFGLEDKYLDNKDKLIETFQLDMSKFTEGWTTYINENSINVSGGEMQKISLIRMFSSEKSVYILDEPTSFMDSESEIRVCEELQKLLIGKTAIIITHRPQILSICNRIIDMEKLKFE